MRTFPEFSRLLGSYLVSQDRTASWLAFRLRVNPSTVNRWLNHEARPGDPETIIRIADILGLHLEPERRALLVAAGYSHQDQADGSPSQKDPESALLAVASDDAAHEFAAHAPAAPVPSSERLRAHPAPFLVPAFPPQGVLGRDELLTQLFEQLALDRPEITNVLPLALQGMGGIGKTTLAIALGRLEAIAELFPDGVLWTAVGPDPTIRSLLNDWGRALSLNLIAERNEEACRERLRSALHYRRALLIVDDVWEVAPGEYFMVAGPRCRLLLTTRESPVAYTLATRERTVAVDVLKPEAALSLLHRLAPDAVSNDAESARRLCERLEYLPLALALAGRLLAYEADVPGRMQRLIGELVDRRAARLQLLQAESRLGLDAAEPVSLQAILGMSVTRLSRLDQERFAMLAVFGAEPLTWELDAAAHVWECSIEKRKSPFRISCSAG